jgi:GDP-L-fucose synthase
VNLKNAKILVTGATGFVGRNLVALMQHCGLQPITPSRKEFDLLEQSAVRRMLEQHQPDVVFHLAGLVGGIGANKSQPADFCYQNLLMSTVMLHESYKAGVKKYIGLMGGCSYPAKAPSPIAETELFNGYPQMESAPYSLAKAMGAVQAEAYRRQYGFNAVVLVPGNIYGPHDNFDLNNSHVIPALIRKFLEAKACSRPEVPAWGSGKPTRDFVYISDVCEAILLAAEKYDGSDIINISAGRTVTIKELTETVAELTGYKGKVVWDTSKPDGQMYKGFDVKCMKEILGFECRTSLRDGLQKTIDWYVNNPDAVRRTG